MLKYQEYSCIINNSKSTLECNKVSPFLFYFWLHLGFGVALFSFANAINYLLHRFWSGPFWLFMVHFTQIYILFLDRFGCSNI